MNNPLRPIVWKLYRAASDRTRRGDAAMKRNNVAWLLEKDGWYTVRKCSVTLYAPGCIRFRNDLNFDIPKRVWPLDDLPQEHFGKMEITIREDEVDTLLPLIVEIAETTGKDYASPLFRDNLVSPSYCWSTRASQHYEQNKRKPKQR
jgi:hypothetical protein